MGVDIKPTPKMCIDYPSAKYHSKYFKDEDFRTLLDMHSAFSYFPSTNPSSSVTNDPKTRVFYPTSECSCVPCNTTYSKNDKNMVNHKGIISYQRDRARLMIDGITDNLEMEALTVISDA